MVGGLQEVLLVEFAPKHGMLTKVHGFVTQFHGLDTLTHFTTVEAPRVEEHVAAGDRTMVAQIESGHAASRRLHEKAGFALVGTIPAAGQKHGRILDLTLMTRRLDRP